MIVSLVNLFLGFALKTGYLGIFLLMAIESTVIPYPSEIIIPPAAYLAQQGSLNLFLVIIVGTLGSLLGATINYVISFTLGRKLVYYLAGRRLAKLLLVNEKKIEKAENIFLKNGSWATFFGRLVPGIRHLISIPAGFSRMPYRSFFAFTFLGSFIWVTMLAILGYLFGAEQDLIEQYYRELSFIIVALAILFTAYAIFKKRKNKSFQPKI